MAAPARYPTPHAQLLRLAKTALSEGCPFEDFWARAVRPGAPPVTWYMAEEIRPDDAIVWPRDTTDRNLARAATEDAREGWRRAYEGVDPEPSERALIILSPILEQLESGRAFAPGDAVPSAA